MAEPTLEERVAALEQEVAALKSKAEAPTAKGARWFEQMGPPMRPELQEALDRALAYGRYFRKTGREAPPDWQPGDPIPEPDWDDAP